MKRFVYFCKWLIFKAIGVFLVDKRFALGVMAFLLLWLPAVSQTDAVPVDTIVVTDFDRIDPVYVSASMDAAKRREYLILKRRVIKTIPYAKMAAMKMKAMEDKLQTIQGRRERSKYVKQCEESIKKMYMDQLKNLTIGEGQVLMKLLHRETGKTSWEIMRNYRGTGEAIFWQAFGSIYGHSLLTEYDPVLDYQIENIIKLERLE
jgi:hypothetical protein